MPRITLTEETLLVFFARTAASSALDPSTALPQPAAIAQPTLPTQTEHALPAPRAKPRQEINLSAVLWAASLATALNAPAAKLTSTSASTAASNVRIALTQKLEPQLLA